MKYFYPDQKYTCPNCSLNLCSENTVVVCSKCNIQYFSVTGNFWINSEVLCNGSFEYCCRYFKLKVFS